MPDNPGEDGAPNRASDRPQDATEEWLAHADLVTGLRDGDLTQLADYLRAGTPLPQWIADEIADMMTGGGPIYNIVTKARKPGELGWSHDLITSRQRMVIGVFFESRVRTIGPGGYEAALEDTMNEFSIEKTAANKCRNHVRRALLNVDPQWRESTWETWRSAYSAP